MSSKLKTSALTLSLMGVLSTGIAAAQDAPATDTPAVQGQTGTVELAIPELLQDDAFADVESRSGRRGGLMIEGSIVESGKDFDAMVNSDGELVGIRTAEGSALPVAVVEALLPEAARANPVLSEITELNAIGTRNGAVMIGGQDAAGDQVRIGFDAEGQLQHFDRGERGGKRMRGDSHGARGAKRGGDDHGQRDGRARRGGEGATPMPPPVDEAALRSAVEAAGYTDLGETLQGRGRGIAIDAVNPQGETVTVFVSPRGEVIRETAR